MILFHLGIFEVKLGLAAQKVYRLLSERGM